MLVLTSLKPKMFTRKSTCGSFGGFRHSAMCRIRGSRRAVPLTPKFWVEMLTGKPLGPYTRYSPWCKSPDSAWMSAAGRCSSRLASIS